MVPVDSQSDPPGETARSGLLPESSLYEPVDLREVEEDLAHENLPDSWLEQWKIFRGRIQPGDEVWDFSDYERGPEDDLDDWRSGYALVRDGRIVAHVCRPFSDP